MTKKYDFELQLELLGEKYFTGNNSLNMARGGNSKGNELYFSFVRKEMKERLKCQVILLNKGMCPDSGIFGDFGYESEKHFSWENIENGDSIAVEVMGANEEIQYIEIPSKFLKTKKILKDKEGPYEIHLNDVTEDDGYFGIEYKAAKSNSPNSISVASFNSTCPSKTKTVELLCNFYHNLPTDAKVKKDEKVHLCKKMLKLTIRFYMYYFIINDITEKGKSIIKQILIADGSFFAPGMTEEKAEMLSKQKKPEDFGEDYKKIFDEARVKLRYRPFFESKLIKAPIGYGLYLTWPPRLLETVREERERKRLLAEIQYRERAINDKDNVIYLSLDINQIKRRAA